MTKPKTYNLMNWIMGVDTKTLEILKKRKMNYIYSEIKKGKKKTR